MFRRTYSPSRRSPRHWWNGSVSVFQDSAHIKAYSVNISDEGMCLFAVADLPVGSQIDVEFHPPNSPRRLRLSGTVRHRALYLYGVEFFAHSSLRDSGSHFAQLEN